MYLRRTKIVDSASLICKQLMPPQGLSRHSNGFCWLISFHRLLPGAIGVYFTPSYHLVSRSAKSLASYGVSEFFIIILSLSVLFPDAL